MQELIRGLNHDLAAEWGTVIRYTYQSSQAVGLVGEKLRDMLSREIADELGHARFLTDVIVDLGGEPTTRPLAFEHSDSLEEMLQLDLELEMKDVDSYAERAEQAADLGLPGLKVKLEEMAADEAGHARDIRRLLKGLS
ncbi:MAG: ferritin-like domain-containing protein [Acidobacteriota bacterium]